MQNKNITFQFNQFRLILSNERPHCFTEGPSKLLLLTNDLSFFSLWWRRTMTSTSTVYCYGFVRNWLTNEKTSNCAETLWTNQTFLKRLCKNCKSCNSEISYWAYFWNKSWNQSSIRC